MSAVLERERHLLDFAVASLARRPTKNIGLTFVYALVVFLLGSVMLFGSAVRREAAAILADAPEIVAQNMVMGRHEMAPAGDLAVLKGLRGVRKVEPRLWGYLWDSAGAANYTLMVPSPDDAAHRIEPGRAIVGEGVARARKLEVGKPFFLVSPSGKFLRTKVQAILSADSALVSSDLVLVDEASFRAFFDVPADRWTDFALSVTNPREVATVSQKASVKLPGYRFVTRADIHRTNEALFSWREGLALALLASSLLAFVILAFDKASGLSAEERREIGILKAIGWETSDVLRMKLWEGVVISLTAFLLGLGAAWVHVFAFSAGVFEPVLKGWSTLYPYFALSPRIDALEIATLALLTIVPYTAATVVPIWKTAVTDPDTVMR